MIEGLAGGLPCSAGSTKRSRSATGKPKPPAPSLKINGWPGSKELLTGDAESIALPGRGRTAAALRPAPGPHRRAHHNRDRRDPTRDPVSPLAPNQSQRPNPSPACSFTTFTTGPICATAGGMIATPWLFPGYRPGKHLDAQSIMMRLRWLGINLLGARNSALGNLVAEVRPPPCGRTARRQLPSHPTPRRTCRPTMVPIHHLVIETTAGFHDHELA